MNPSVAVRGGNAPATTLVDPHIEPFGTQPGKIGRATDKGPTGDWITFSLFGTGGVRWLGCCEACKHKR